LPLQLTRHGPEHSGFATTQKTLVALYGAVRHLANPASLDSVPVSEMVEDHASMAAHAVAKTGAMVAPLRLLAAIELLAAAQAVDLRGLSSHELGVGMRLAHAAVRARVPMLDVDRPQGPDIEAISAGIEAGEFPLADLLAR
jgi:histidine ammonia-lyase